MNFFLHEDQTRPIEREIWRKLDQAFEHGIQNYQQKLKNQVLLGLGIGFPY